MLPTSSAHRAADWLAAQFARGRYVRRDRARRWRTWSPGAEEAADGGRRRSHVVGTGPPLCPDWMLNGPATVTRGYAF
jgi:hypothetical protein